MSAASLILAMTLLFPQAAAEKIVHETDSLYHHIIVSETAHLRILRFHKGPARNALGSPFSQSTIYLSDPDALYPGYAKYSVVAAAQLDKPSRALFVGLGAGSIPKFFARLFPDCRMDVAELDEKVVEVARTYFFLPELDNMKTTVMDGRMFVRRATDKYDLIFLDAYRDSAIPFHLLTSECLEEVKKKLAPGGLLVSNLAVRDSSQLYPWLLRTYQNSFATVFVAKIPNTINSIVLAWAQPDAVSSDDLVNRATEYASRLKLPFDLVHCARAYKDRSSATPSEKILTDDYAPVNLMRLRKADEKDWEY